MQTKEDIKKYKQEYAKRNAFKIAESQKQYYINNKDKILLNSKEYYFNNKDKVLIYQKNYTRKKEINKIYRLKNKDKFTAYIKEYRLKNKPKIRTKDKEYWTNRRANDLVYRLDMNIAGAIYKAIKRNNKYSRAHWQKYVGYSIQELIEHIESRFEDWMSWDNYGKWHIDHIKPKTSFNYQSFYDEDFKKCWALSNLQPLEASENIRKSNKYNVKTI